MAPIKHVVRDGNELFRIFDPGGKYRCDDFRSGSPRYRFDHHIAADPGRRILYCAPTLECCIVEKFGDIGVIEYGGNRRCVLRALGDLSLLDLRNNGAMRAGTVFAINAEASTTLTQAWSRHFYENIPVYGVIDGILYSSAHNALDAMALYERAEGKIKQIDDRPLGDASLQYAIYAAADRNALTIA